MFGLFGCSKVPDVKNEELISYRYSSGGGMTGKITPSAVLVIQDGHSKLISVKGQDSVSKILDMVPDVISKFTKSGKKEKEPDIPEDVFDSVTKE